MDFIERLYIEPTSACNLKCSMCFRNNWIDEKLGFMSDEIFGGVLTALNDITTIKSVMFGGMGEPLLHKNIAAMLSLVKQKNIKTELLTNATMLNEKMAEELIETGLDMLWISVDGFDRSAYEKIHKGSEFDVIIKNIEYFNKIKGNCKTGLTFVIMQDNIDELIKVNGFADLMKFDMINLSYAVPCESVKDIDSCYDTGFCIGKQERVDFSEYHNRKTNYCPFIEEKNCFVKWNGEVVPCMQLLHSSYSYLYEEKRKIQSKSFGNIQNKNLLEKLCDYGRLC